MISETAISSVQCGYLFSQRLLESFPYRHVYETTDYNLMFRVIPWEYHRDIWDRSFENII